MAIGCLFDFRSDISVGINDGDITEWGIFSTGSAGYAIAGKDAANNFKGAMQFAPYYKFTPYEVLSLDEAARIMQSMKP